jgi:hypothetical protein
VLADIGFGEAEFIGQQESLAILLERKPPILVDRMDWHRKESKLHGLLFPKGRLFYLAQNVLRSPLEDKLNIHPTTNLTFADASRLISQKCR